MKKYEMQMISDYIYDREIIDENEFKNLFFELFPERSQRYFNFYIDIISYINMDQINGNLVNIERHLNLNWILKKE